MRRLIARIFGSKQPSGVARGVDRRERGFAKRTMKPDLAGPLAAWGELIKGRG